MYYKEIYISIGNIYLISRNTIVLYFNLNKFKINVFDPDNRIQLKCLLYNSSNMFMTN